MLNMHHKHVLGVQFGDVYLEGHSSSVKAVTTIITRLSSQGKKQKLKNKQTNKRNVSLKAKMRKVVRSQINNI